MGAAIEKWHLQITVNGIPHMKKNFFIEKVVRHWDGLPRAVVQSPSVEVFKRLENAALQDIAW